MLRIVDDMAALAEGGEVDVGVVGGVVVAMGRGQHHSGPAYGPEDVHSAGPDAHLTSTAVAPDGRWAALRTYGGVWEWPVGPGGLAEALLGPARPIPTPWVGQGEAIAYAADGAALLLTGEGSPAPLARVPLTRGDGEA